MATSRKNKPKDPYNLDNREFRTNSMNPYVVKRAVECMRTIGCKNRVVFLEMAIKEYSDKILGKDNE